MSTPDGRAVGSLEEGHRTEVAWRNCAEPSVGSLHVQRIGCERRNCAEPSVEGLEVEQRIEVGCIHCAEPRQIAVLFGSSAVHVEQL